MERTQREIMQNGILNPDSNKWWMGYVYLLEIHNKKGECK